MRLVTVVLSLLQSYEYIELIYNLTLVFPPLVIEMSTGVFVFHDPFVKSGTSTEFDRFATDLSLNGPITLQAAAS